MTHSFEDGELLVARRDMDRIVVTSKRLIIGDREWLIGDLLHVRTSIWFVSIERDLLPDERQMKDEQTVFMVIALILSSAFVRSNVFLAGVLLMSWNLDYFFKVKPRYGYQLMAIYKGRRITLLQDYRRIEVTRLRRAIYSAWALSRMKT